MVSRGTVAVNISYKQELISYAKDEIEPLAELEWEESGHPTQELKIDWDAYYDLESRGVLSFFSARQEGKLIGYFVVLCVAPLTAKGETIGYYDSVYVHRDYRKSSVGKRLFKFVETCMKEDGIKRVIASSSKKNPIGKFLDRMGYFEIETKYEKVL